MTNRLQSLGYTQREATFLEKAALISGYFQRGQYNGSIKRECGAVGQQFIDRAARLRHIELLKAYLPKRIYHVRAHLIYSALGDADNRNRKAHRPEAVRRRLMALDLVLGRPQENWLLTTEAATAFLSMFVSEEPVLQEVRALERQPVCSTSANSVEFVFIDSGFGDFSKWEKFLRMLRRV